MIKLTMLVAIPKHNKDEVKYAIAGHTYDFCTKINGKNVYFFKHLREDDVVFVSLEDAMKAIDEGIKLEQEKKEKSEYERFSWMKLGKEVFTEDAKHAKGYFVSKIGLVSGMRVLAVRKVDSYDAILNQIDKKEYHYVNVLHDVLDLSSDEDCKLVVASNDSGEEEMGIELSQIYTRNYAKFIFLTLDQVNELYCKKINYLKEQLEKTCDFKKDVNKDFTNEIESRVEAI